MDYTDVLVELNQKKMDMMTKMHEDGGKFLRSYISARAALNKAKEFLSEKEWQEVDAELDATMARFE